MSNIEARVSIDIRIKSYPPEASVLVDIWNRYVGVVDRGFPIDNVITFKNKRPRNAKNSNRRIAGLKAESLAYLGNDEELVKMSVENFIYLMAKCGVEIEAKEIGLAGGVKYDG